MIAVTRTMNADSSFFIINPAYDGCMVALKDARYLRVSFVGFYMRAIHSPAAHCDDPRGRIVRDKGFIT